MSSVTHRYVIRRGLPRMLPLSPPAASSQSSLKALHIDGGGAHCQPTLSRRDVTTGLDNARLASQSFLSLNDRRTTLPPDLLTSSGLEVIGCKRSFRWQSKAQHDRPALDF